MRSNYPLIETSLASFTFSHCGKEMDCHPFMTLTLICYPRIHMRDGVKQDYNVPGSKGLSPFPLRNRTVCDISVSKTSGLENC